MEALDVPLEGELAEKLTNFVPYLYTDTLKLLFILDLLNLCLIISNFISIIGLQINSRIRTILANIFVIEFIVKSFHLFSVSLIYNRKTVTYKDALIFIVIYGANYAFYALSKIVNIAALASDKVINSESLKSWKVLACIYSSVILIVSAGVMAFLYYTTFVSSYVLSLMAILFLLGLFIFISVLRKEFKRLRRSHEMTDGDLMRVTLLRILIYVPIIILVICVATLKKQAILDLCPVVMFLYLIYVRRINSKKVRDALKQKQKSGDKKKSKKDD